ncbi:glycosyltransferase family 2 protein [Lentibacillus juripiscarius]|uniref:Glycosyltransferase family 2 protein n=1 Tax=Lentibacillus juripiscarius TaxID=257446 RepID=A0ABW5V3G4_9BACI
MLKDITAILFQYSDQAALHKALSSLNKVSSRLKSVIVFQDKNMPFKLQESGWFEIVWYTDLGDRLNKKIKTIDTPYVLLLHGTDYISPSATAETIQLPQQKEVLGTFYHNRATTIHQPLLVRTPYLKEHPVLSASQLPFKEALLPSWLAKADPSLTTFSEGLVKQAKKNSSRNTIEKQTFLQKYQLEETNIQDPSFTIMIANYNMEAYVETAVASCLLQTEQPDELLIMDDGSTDKSFELLQQWRDGQQVKVFNKQNGGKARALNELLPLVHSDFILELDADDWLDPDAISVIKTYLAESPEDVSVLYGNLRKWKQLSEDVLFKGVAKGNAIKGKGDLLAYRFPLGPRIYRTSSLRREGGFPVITFENGMFYEDVSVLNRLLKKHRFLYEDFTVYNVREHKESITNNAPNWNDFLKTLE